MAGYDDRDGKIWMDGGSSTGAMRISHVLTHALHYASSVFEGERAYGGGSSGAANIPSACISSANMIDFRHPLRWTRSKRPSRRCLPSTA